MKSSMKQTKQTNQKGVLAEEVNAPKEQLQATQTEANVGLQIEKKAQGVDAPTTPLLENKPETSNEVQASNVPASAEPQTDAPTTELEEVDSSLADLLMNAEFLTGNSNHSSRQLNAALAIVNHKNGKRVKVQKEILHKLELQLADCVQVTVKNKQVILMKSLTDNGMQLKPGCCLYSKELVKSITDEFQLDFTTHSTQHLMNVTYKKWNEQPIALITL